LVFFDDVDHLFGIARIGGISRLFESPGPPGKIGGFQLEKGVVARIAHQEIRMVHIGILYGLIFPETLIFLIIVVV